MLIAILTDIHANAVALEAVLRDVRRHKPDRYVFGGDLAINGPRPMESLEQIMALGASSVRGNMDDELLHGSDSISAWARAKLSPEGLAFLSALPLTQRITPSGGKSPEDDLLIMHSTPRSNNDLLILELSDQTTSFKEITPPEQAEVMLAGVMAKRMVYGHIHYFSNGIVGGQHIGSIGAVGFPFDGDRRAAYALANWQDGEWHIRPMRVEYEFEGVARDIEQSGQPLPQRYAAMIREARWLPKPETHP